MGIHHIPQPQPERSIVRDLLDIFRRLRELEQRAFAIERAALKAKIERLEQERVP